MLNCDYEITAVIKLLLKCLNQRSQRESRHDRTAKLRSTVLAQILIVVHKPLVM